MASKYPEIRDAETTHVRIIESRILKNDLLPPALAKNGKGK